MHACIGNVLWLTILLAPGLHTAWHLGGFIEHVRPLAFLHSVQEFLQTSVLSRCCVPLHLIRSKSGQGGMFYLQLWPFCNSLCCNDHKSPCQVCQHIMKPEQVSGLLQPRMRTQSHASSLACSCYSNLPPVMTARCCAPEGAPYFVTICSRHQSLTPKQVSHRSLIYDIDTSHPASHCPDQLMCSPYSSVHFPPLHLTPVCCSRVSQTQAGCQSGSACNHGSFRKEINP